MDATVPPLAEVEALRAAGRAEEARQATERAKRRLLRRADRVTDATIRARYLSHPENAQTLALPED
jgi:hypothetical protein